MKLTKLRNLWNLNYKTNENNAYFSTDASLEHCNCFLAAMHSQMGMGRLQCTEKPFDCRYLTGKENIIYTPNDVFTTFEFQI